MAWLQLCVCLLMFASMLWWVDREPYPFIGWRRKLRKMAETPWKPAPRPYLRPALDSVQREFHGPLRTRPGPPPPPNPAKNPSRQEERFPWWVLLMEWLLSLHPESRRLDRLEREEAEADRLMHEAEKAAWRRHLPSEEDARLAAEIDALAPGARKPSRVAAAYWDALRSVPPTRIGRFDLP